MDLVIHAAAKVMQEVDAQLFIVGDGKQREELIQLSQSLGIYQNCRFPGFISKHGDLPGIYRLARVFVTASEIEILSSVVMEAAASGLPVVTVQASSMPEFVIDGDSGYLVPPEDIDLMAERLILLVKDHEKIKKNGPDWSNDRGNSIPTSVSCKNMKIYMNLFFVYQNAIVKKKS